MARNDEDFDWGDYFDEGFDCEVEIPNQNEGTYEQGGVFVPPELSREIFGLIYANACVDGLARHIPMKRLEMLFRTVEQGTEAYWVGAQCVKPKTSMEFGMQEIRARKMAVIVPFEDQLLEDADTDIVGLVKDDLAKRFVLKKDASFLGYDITTPFPDSISGNVPAANIVPLGMEGPDLAGDVSYAISLIESYGLDPTGMITHPRIKHELRNLRDDNNQPIFETDMSICNPRDRYCLWGYPICFSAQVADQTSPNGYEILIADFDKVIIGDRTGMQYTFSKDATLTSGSLDNINLFEQDMTAIRAVLRVGFLISDDNALAKVTGVAP
jgi:HK97 family phage major capsid protein